MRSVLALVLLALAAGASAQPHAPHTRAIEFPDVAGYQTLVVDLHMHTVFSDGAVWPSVRAQEAVRDGLDAIAATEHLEYQPHAGDIPHPDRNRSFAIMAAAAPDSLLVLNGAEITRELPVGHANAIFVRDANALLVDDALDAFREAKQQGAFTFLNHPNWTGQRADGLAALTDVHRQLIAEGLLDGIEVANDLTVSEEALGLALAHGLTVLGTSDIHGLVDWQHDVHAGGHRPVTLAFAADKSEAGLREALDAGRTVAVFRHRLLGRAEHVQPLLDASLVAASAAYRGDSAVLVVRVENRSEVPFTLLPETALTFHASAGAVTVPAHGSARLELKPGTRVPRVEVPFRVLNALTAPGEHPVWTLVAEADAGE